MSKIENLRNKAQTWIKENIIGEEISDYKLDGNTPLFLSDLEIPDVPQLPKQSVGPLKMAGGLIGDIITSIGTEVAKKALAKIIKDSPDSEKQS